MFISNVMRRGEGGGLPCSAQIVLKVYLMTVSKCVACLYVCLKYIIRYSKPANSLTRSPKTKHPEYRGQSFLLHSHT